MIPGPPIHTFRQDPGDGHAVIDPVDDIPRLGPLATVRGWVRFPAMWAFLDCPTRGCGDGYSYPNDSHDWMQTSLPTDAWQRGQSGVDVTCDRCNWRGMVTRPPVPLVWWYDRLVDKIGDRGDPWAAPVDRPSKLRRAIAARLRRHSADRPPF